MAISDLVNRGIGLGIALGLRAYDRLGKAALLLLVPPAALVGWAIYACSSPTVAYPAAAAHAPTPAGVEVEDQIFAENQVKTKKPAPAVQVKKPATAPAVDPEDAALPKRKPATPAADPEDGPLPAAKTRPGAFSKRPARVADWRKDDYLSARAEGDPRLIEAVGHVGESFVGNPSAARLVAGLLAAPAGRGLAPRGSQQEAALLEAVMAALLANDTDAAREILQQVLAGTLAVAEDRAAVDALLKAAADHAGPQTDALLVEAATSAESWRGAVPAQPGRMAAAELQAKVLAALRGLDSPALRVKLARQAIDPRVSAAVRDKVIELLKETSPLNVAAQVFLYQNPQTEAKVKSALEPHFERQSAAALACVLGVPLAGTQGKPAVTVTGGPEDDEGPRVASPAAGPIASRPVDESEALVIGQTLWTAAFAAAVQQRMVDRESFQDMGPTLALAGALPLPATRAALCRTLRTYWWDAAPALGRARDKLADATMNDPGLLVVLKAVAGGDDGEKAIASLTRPKTGRLAPPKIKISPANEAAKKNREQREKTVIEWHKTVLAQVQQTCRRFREAARMQPSKRAAAAAALPFELHPGAQMTAAYSIDWPPEGRFGQAEIDPLRVRYVRTEERNLPGAIVGHYRQQLGDRPELRVPRGIWLQGLQVLKNGRKRSVDVLLCQAGEAAIATSMRDKQGVIVEILTVETKDPNVPLDQEPAEVDNP